MIIGQHIYLLYEYVHEFMSVDLKTGCKYVIK